jgi:hypothetical protein
LILLLESNLTPLSNPNIIFKYADDKSLLVQEHTYVPLQAMLDAIQRWAANIKMITN